MAMTLRINQKHVERAAFTLIIIILLSLLLNEKYSDSSEGIAQVTGYTVKDLLPKDNNDVSDTVPDTSTTSTTTTSLSSATTTSSTSTSTSTTTTTTAKELTFTIDDIAYEKIDDDKAKIKSFYIDITNGLGDSVDLTLKYYIYDDESLVTERTTAKKPYLNIGFVGSKKSARKKFNIDKYVFNLDLEKTMKFQLMDEDQDIEKTTVKKVEID